MLDTKHTQLMRVCSHLVCIQTTSIGESNDLSRDHGSIVLIRLSMMIKGERAGNI